MSERDFEMLAEELSCAAARLYQNGLQQSDGGNLSARLPGAEAMLVKGTGVDFAGVSAKTLAVTDFDGNVIRGDVEPSKEALLHGALYRALPQVRAVVHCHSPWATACASTGRPLPFATHHARLKLGGPAEVFDTGSYMVPPSAFPDILAFFARAPDAKAFLLKGHGQVAVGETVRAAVHLAELVEETAQIAILSKIAE